MIKPDIIVCWPKNTDYPLWRDIIRKERHRFDKVIISFTETFYGDDYRAFIMDAMSQDGITFLQAPLPVKAGDDWRNLAVNDALLHSNSEWVFFTEEDFFWKDRFWDYVHTVAEDPQVMSIEVRDGDRMHPCCLFIKRVYLGMTKKDFGIVPDVSDHFSLIQKNLDTLAHELSLKRIIIPDEYYSHMAGLSHNMRLIWEGNDANHAVEEFNFYLMRCMNVGVVLDPRFSTLVKEYLGDELDSDV